MPSSPLEHATLGKDTTVPIQRPPAALQLFVLVVATAVVGFKIYCQDEGVAYDGFEIYAYPTLLALFAVEILLIFLTRRRFAETVAATSTQGSADAIAGYYTGVALTSMVEREVARAGRAGRALAILMIDVALDDPNGGGANGSPAPDVGKMTRLIRESTRNSDVLGQFEPGELALVLSDTPTDHAGIVAAKLRRRLDTLAPNADPGRLNVKLVTARQAEDGTGIVWRFDEAFEEPVIGG